MAMLLWLHGCILCAICSVKGCDETVSEHVYVAQDSHIPSKQAETAFHTQFSCQSFGDAIWAWNYGCMMLTMAGLRDRYVRHDRSKF